MCTECTQLGYTTTLPLELKLYKVSWQPSVETYDQVRYSGTPEAKAQLEALLSGTADPEPTVPAKRAMVVEPFKLTDRRDANVYDVTIGQAIRQKVCIHPLPINPNTDIHPTGRHCIHIRPVIRYKAAEEVPSPEKCPERGRVLQDDMACVYGPDGRCVTMLEPRTVAELHHRFWAQTGQVDKERPLTLHLLPSSCANGINNCHAHNHMITFTPDTNSACPPPSKARCSNTLSAIRKGSAAP